MDDLGQEQLGGYGTLDVIDRLRVELENSGRFFDIIEVSGSPSEAAPDSAFNQYLMNGCIGRSISLRQFMPLGPLLDEWDIVRSGLMVVVEGVGSAADIDWQLKLAMLMLEVEPYWWSPENDVMGGRERRKNLEDFYSYEDRRCAGMALVPARLLFDGATDTMWLGRHVATERMLDEPVVLIRKNDKAELLPIRKQWAARWRFDDDFFAAGGEGHEPNAVLVNRNALWDRAAPRRVLTMDTEGRPLVRPAVEAETGRDRPDSDPFDGDDTPGARWLRLAWDELESKGASVFRGSTWDALFAAKQAWALRPNDPEPGEALIEFCRTVRDGRRRRELQDYLAEWQRIGQRPAPVPPEWRSHLPADARPDGRRRFGLRGGGFGWAVFPAEAAGDPDAIVATRAIHNSVVLRHSAWPLVGWLCFFLGLSTWPDIWYRWTYLSVMSFWSLSLALWTQRSRLYPSRRKYLARSWRIWLHPLPWADLLYLTIPVALGLIYCSDPLIGSPRNPSSDNWYLFVTGAIGCWLILFGYLGFRAIKPSWPRLSRRQNDSLAESIRRGQIGDPALRVSRRARVVQEDSRGRSMRSIVSVVVYAAMAVGFFMLISFLTE